MPSNGHDDASTAIVDALMQVLEELRAVRKQSLRGADAMLVVNATINKLVPILEQQGRGIYDVPQLVQTQGQEHVLLAREHLDEAKAVHEKTVALARDELRSKLDVISENVKEHRREQTGQHRLVHDEDGTAVKVARLVFGMSAWRFVVIVAAVLILAIGSGVFGSWWHATFGSDTTSTKVETHTERHHEAP